MSSNKLFCILFIIIWAILVILNVIIEAPEFSETENRSLATIPSFSFNGLVEGSYASGLDNYINDHFVFRDMFLKIKSTSEILTFKKENNGVYIGENGYLFEKKLKVDFENVDNSINKINSFVKKIDIPVYFTLIPNSDYILKEYMPKYSLNYNQKEIIEYVYSKIENINTVNVLNTLIDNKNEYIYYLTDHHMTSFGSYLVYNDILNKMGKKYHELNKNEIKVISESFKGTLDSKAQVNNQKVDKIELYEFGKPLEIYMDNQKVDSMYNESYLERKDKYSYFLDGNHSLVKLITNSDNSENLLIIKDSYANNMIPMMLQDFKEIHVIDPRYYRFSISEYITQNKIDTVLFIYNVSNFESELGLRTLK